MIRPDEGARLIQVRLASKPRASGSVVDLSGGERADFGVVGGLNFLAQGGDFVMLGGESQTSSGRPLRVVETYAAVSW
jgi:hypothetical protein